MFGKVVSRGLAMLVLVFAAGSAAADPSGADARVDAIVREAMADRRIPGLQIAVVKDRRIALQRSYGVANLQAPAPVTDETVFSINSITKAFTGVAAMQEVEAGRLDLSAPVSTYLADLPEAWRGVTIRQLLSHMSGIPNFVGKARGADDVAAWAWAESQPMLFPPGDRFNYSQTNYGLVQKLVNGLEGRPANAVLPEAQMRVAGMTRTGFGDSNDVIPGKAAGYRYDYSGSRDGVLRQVFEEFSPLHRAASGMNSTAGDMARWLIAIDQGRLLKPASLQAMWTPAAFNRGKPGQWAIGWTVIDRPEHRMVGMTGGSRAAVSFYPDDHVGVVILTNLSGAYPEELIERVAMNYIPGMRLTGVAALQAALEADRFKDGGGTLARLQAADPGFTLPEDGLNDWGYRLLSGGKPREALEVMKVLATLHPRSGNAFDSLADAYEANGDKVAAIANYRRSLELDPANANATRRLKKLEAS